MNKEFNPKIIPTIVGVVLLLIFIAKATVTIGSGKDGMPIILGNQ